MSKTITVLIFYAKVYDNFDKAMKEASSHFEIREIPNGIKGLAEYRKIIGCDYVEITGRKIGNKPYWCICDENGRYVDDVIFTVASQNGYLDIPGTVIITGPEDMNGDLTSLTTQDITNIISHICLGEQEINGKRMIIPMIVY